MKFAFGPETHPLPGYTIKRAIDRGGFGEVYYALSDSGKEVALKLLRDNPDIELRGVSQCLNLKHPNLVTLFDVRTDPEGESWVIMEYISGDSLEQVLGKHPRGLPVEEVMQWLTGAADGIAYLHERGIVHRDLKPANIFRDQGIVKIGDVGLSKFMSPSRRSAQTESVGTVHYMAPEVARGKYGRELDVYSLAVIVFEMLTGRVPFDGESTAEILMKHLTARPDLSAVAPHFRPVLERALEKDPHRRTPSIRQFMDEFHQAYRASRANGELGNGIAVANDSGTKGIDGKDGRRTTAAPRSLSDTDWRTEPTSAGRGRTLEQRDHGKSNNTWLWIAIPAALLFLTMRNGWTRGYIPFQFMPTWGFFALALLGGAAYVTYLIVSGLVSHLLSPPVSHHPRGGLLDRTPQETANGTSASPAALRVPASPPVKPHPRIWLGPEQVRDISVASRWQDIFTSMTWATFWTLVSMGVLSIGLQTLGGDHLRTRLMGSEQQLGQFALTTLAAAWVLIPVSKLMEGSRLPSQQRRLVLALSGAAVGLFAWFLEGIFGSGLKVDPGLSHGLVSRLGSWDLVQVVSVAGRTPSGTAQVPTLVGFMTFFSVLFALRRWSNQTDSFRVKRFRWLSWLFTGMVAWAVTSAFTFPPLWAVTWGLALSAVVQLSSGWIASEERYAWLNAEQHRIAKNRAPALEVPQSTGVA